jgi:hypothetical protein
MPSRLYACWSYIVRYCSTYHIWAADECWRVVTHCKAKFECPSYDHLHSSCTTVFYRDGTVDRYAPELVSKILSCDDQEHLAVVVYQMWLYRSVLLGLSPDHPSVPVQPDDYVPSDDTLDAIASTP